MARATRSTANHEKDNKPQNPPPSPRKSANKKRKRISNGDSDDALPVKHSRTDTDEDGTPEHEDHSEDGQYKLPSSGDIPSLDADAHNILGVLEMIDTQGFLDRVFPLPTDSVEHPSSASSTSMLSLRALLQNSSQYPLRVLRLAVKHLYPISSHPRFRPSQTAAQQLRFCNLATSLLDKASRNNAPVPLNASTIITDTDTQQADSASPTAPLAGVRPRKYAMVQHLPTGDWWSSVSSSVPTTDGNGADFKSLHTARAELVSIFPSTSASELAHKGTLGDYAVKRPQSALPYKGPPPRRVSCGKFLDYGPYASFAPSFDQEGVEVGRLGMGEVIYYQEMRRRLRSLAKGKRRAFLAPSDRTPDDVVMEDASASSLSTPVSQPQPQENAQDLTKSIESLLPPDEVEKIKASLGTLEMEQAVDELLQRNAKALVRLEELQLTRLRAQKGGSSVVEVGSEEWDIAQGITDSLTVLASLRPRLSNDDADRAPLIPSASVLHKLHRTLPLQATEGWYGTLPDGRTTAFHDDTTIHVRAGSAAPAKTAPVPVPVTASVTATPTPKATTPAPPFTPYPYTSSYPNSQYRGMYGTYTPTQGSYYPSATYGTTAGQQGAHYPSAQYGATGQSQYYSAWYANSGAGQAASAQPGAAGMSGNFTSYFAPGAPPAAQPQRAVANTVLSTPAKQQQAYPQAGYPTPGGYVAPTLPPHMRPSATGTSTSGEYGTYYGGYAAPR